MAKRPYGRKKVSGAVRRASNWPLFECLVATDWQEAAGLVQVLVARQSPQTDEIAVAVFLVDLGCLGAKNALVQRFQSEYEYRRELRDNVTSTQEMVEADLDLAAKIVEEAIRYAKSLGFKPHRDAKEARTFLAGAEPNARPEEIPLGGDDGKPLYVAGPYDNPERILRILERNVGPGNFHYVVAVENLPSDD